MHSGPPPWVPLRHLGAKHLGPWKPGYIIVLPTLLCLVITGPCLLDWEVFPETGLGPQKPRGCLVSVVGHLHCLFDCLHSPQTNWMRSWPLLSRPSVQARVLGLVALRPWASTGPKGSLPLR